MLEVDFVHFLVVEPPPPCRSPVLFQLCRNANVIVLHDDQFLQEINTLDIGMTQDYNNLDSPCKKPLVEVLPLGEDL